MSSENVQNIFSPDKDAMKAHLDFLFSDIPAQYTDGLIEICYLTGSKYFPVKDTAAAAEQAFIWNQEGRNIYTTASVLVPDVVEKIKARETLEGKPGRARGEDFYAANAVWVDLDDIKDIEVLKAAYKDAPPNFYVVTGRTPNLRSHLWWALDKICTDKVILETVNKGLIKALGGDKGTHNCTRLMRLAGGVAWPTGTKKGRVTELVEARNTSWFPPHSIERLLKIYKLEEPKAEHKPESHGAKMNFNQSEGWTENDVLNMLNHIKPDSEYFDWLSVGMALKDYNMPFGMYDNWSSTGADYPGSKELRVKWDSFKRKGITIGTLYYHASNGGYKPANYRQNSYNSTFSDFKTQADPDPETGEYKQLFEAIDIADIDLDNIPPRAWLFGDIVARKYVTMIAASPGAGKSVFTMQAALCAAAGKGFGPHMPHEKNINVWVYNNEEGTEELRRRVAAMIKHEEIDKTAIAGRFFMNSGENHSICIAKKSMKDGGVIHTPDFEQLKAQIIARKIDLLIVDPFAETHALRENDNDEIKAVAGMYRRLAIECNCAVLLVHHTRKGSNSGDKSSEQNSNADSARGGGAQIGVVRRMFTLAKMDSVAAANMNVSDEHRYWYIRFDDAKTNITAPTQMTQWFKFVSVSLNNSTGLYAKGDSVGVLEYKTKEEIMQQEGDSMKEERLLLCQKIAFIMVCSGSFEITIPELLKALKSNGYTRYKERKLREFIKQTLLYNAPKHPVICEGNSCFMKYVEGSGAPEPSKITLRIEEIQG